MNEILELLKIYESLFELNRSWKQILIEYLNKDNHKLYYFKLKYYFKIYVEKNKLNQTIKEYWIDPILKMNDCFEAFSMINSKYIDLSSEQNNQIKNIDKSTLYQHNIRIIDVIYKIKMDIWELIEKDIYEIKIDITEKEPNIETKTKYEKVIELYLGEHYEKAFQAARDIFQESLEKNFNSNIKHFERENDELSKEINKLLNIISNIRNNFAKNKSFNSLTKTQQKAITKFSIEQLISIENFIRINEFDKNKL